MTHSISINIDELYTAGFRMLGLAHASPALIEDVVGITDAPVVASHTGVRGSCNNPRNLSDENLRGIARTGGVIGVGFWSTAVCGVYVQAIVWAIRYTSDLVGVEKKYYQMSQ